MIAIISDVHGNLPALQAVLADVDAAGATRIWCLGDTLGYGPFVNECMLLVSQRCELVLAGNHDLAVRGDLPVESFAGTAEAGISYAMARLDQAGATMLATLKPQRLLEGVELYHASANDPVWEYVIDKSAATRHLNLQRAPLSLVGHSHIQLAFHLGEGDRRARGGKVADGTVLDIGATAGAPTAVSPTKLVCNPGAVGQPRDRNPRAAWALLEQGRISFRRVGYDIARMRAAVDDAGLPAEIGERLELGW